VVTAYFVLAVLCTVLWIPVLLHFYRSWVGRHNPISLAICAAVLLAIWTAIAGAWLVTEVMDVCTVIFVSTCMSTAVAVFAHLAFYWSKKRFPETRQRR